MSSDTESQCEMKKEWRRTRASRTHRQGVSVKTRGRRIEKECYREDRDEGITADGSRSNGFLILERRGPSILARFARAFIVRNSILTTRYSKDKRLLLV